ncbi:MAG: hypothetical protein ACRCUT_11410 [Spirochaetota bacterium]
MRISTGLAEIYTPRTDAASPATRTYLWPVYDAGKVDPVFRVTREIDGQGFYTKPTPEEKERLLNMMQSRKTAASYNAAGGIAHAGDHIFKPGTFFDAMA